MSASIRVSILFFYRRLFANPGQNIIFAIIIYTLMALQFVYVVIFMSIPSMVCHPFSAAWDLYAFPTHCNAWTYIQQTQALYGTSLGFDIILLLLPIWPIASLRLPAKKRAGILVLFLLGTR